MKKRPGLFNSGPRLNVLMPKGGPRRQKGDTRKNQWEPRKKSKA